MFNQDLSLRRKKLFRSYTDTDKKCNFPGKEWLAKLMCIISAKVKLQSFVQKTKQWSQIKNDLAKKKI